MTLPKVNKPNWIQYAILTSLVVLIVVSFMGVKILSADYTQEEFDVAVESAIANANAIKDSEIATLNADLTNLNNEIATDAESVVEENSKYKITDLYIGYGVDEELTDREISLFDGDVDFDGDEYGAEGTLFISGLNLTANDDDFNSDIYVVANEGDIRYVMEFDRDLNTSLIGNDNEYLKFNLLGKEVEVSEWNNNEVTFRYGQEVMMDEGESINVEGNNVVLSFVSDDSIYVEVDGLGKKIDEGETASVGGLEVYASEVLYTSKSSSTSKAILRVGEEVESTVEDGEEYEEDSVWEWEITENSIGLVLAEEYKYLDEDYKPLATGENICLPNDYICVEFGGLVDEKYREYDFVYKESRNEVKITGNFVVGHDDVETIIARADGTFYNDDDDENITDVIELEDSGLVLNFSTDYKYLLLKLGNEIQMNISFNISSVNVDSNPLSQEEDYRSNHGIIVTNTEDIDEDQELSISVPEEKVEGFFLVY